MPGATPTMQVAATGHINTNRIGHGTRTIAQEKTTQEIPLPSERRSWNLHDSILISEFYGGILRKRNSKLEMNDLSNPELIPPD